MGKPEIKNLQVSTFLQTSIQYRQEPNLFGRFTNNKILVGVVLRFVFNMALNSLIKSLNHPKTWEPIKVFYTSTILQFETWYCTDIKRQVVDKGLQEMNDIITFILF